MVFVKIGLVWPLANLLMFCITASLSYYWVNVQCFTAMQMITKVYIDIQTPARWNTKTSLVWLTSLTNSYSIWIRIHVFYITHARSFTKLCKKNNYLKTKQKKYSSTIFFHLQTLICCTTKLYWALPLLWCSNNFHTVDSLIHWYWQSYTINNLN